MDFGPCGWSGCPAQPGILPLDMTQDSRTSDKILDIYLAWRCPHTYRAFRNNNFQCLAQHWEYLVHTMNEEDFEDYIATVRLMTEVVDVLGQIMCQPIEVLEDMLYEYFDL